MWKWFAENWKKKHFLEWSFTLHYLSQLAWAVYFCNSAVLRVYQCYFIQFLKFGTAYQERAIYISIWLKLLKRTVSVFSGRAFTSNVTTTFQVLSHDLQKFMKVSMKFPTSYYEIWNTKHCDSSWNFTNSRFPSID